MERLRELAHLRIQEPEFKHVLGQEEGDAVGFAKLAEPLQESVRGAETHVEIKGEQNLLFHVEDLFSGVLIICDVDEIFQEWWIYFLVLGDY